ncbi:MAG: hypothetical protein ACT4O1_03785 [Gemmatimonadota bacterium]
MAARTMNFAVLLDEHHEPPLRQTLSSLITTARTADFAIAHLRLAGLDLKPSETDDLERCRVMIGHLDAAVLFDAVGPGPAHFEVLAAFAQSGRLEMHTAPHHAWNPDFSIFRDLPNGGDAALLGAHYFGRPYPRFGLAFTCVMTQSAAVRACTRRFEELWAAGYDVLPVVIDALERLGA